MTFNTRNNSLSTISDNSSIFEACFESEFRPFHDCSTKTDFNLCPSITTGLNSTPDDYGIHSFEHNCLSSASISSLNAFEDLDFVEMASPNAKANALLPISKKISRMPADSNQITKPKKDSASKVTSKRKAWTASEDEKIREFYNLYGPHWTKISFHIPNRNGKQVRDRYLNVLAANIKKAGWTIEEDRFILKMMNEMGPQWRKISKLIEGRTEMQVKNRYYTHLKKHRITFENEEPRTIAYASTNADSLGDSDAGCSSAGFNHAEESLEKECPHGYAFIGMSFCNEEESGFFNDLMKESLDF